MSEKKYPEEIYPKYGFKTDAFGRLTQWTTCNSDFERAYDLGYEHGKQAQSDPLAGWSNLTEAIQGGERIDWGALDGLEAKCVHPDMGTLTYKLELEEGLDGYLPHPVDSPQAWHEEGSELEAVIESAWLGNDSWTLYIKGDLPLRKQTADQLEPGTIFEAVLTDEEDFGPVTLLRVDAGIIDTGDWQKLDVDLACIEVSRVRGTFQTPEGDA